MQCDRSHAVRIRGWLAPWARSPYYILYRTRQKVLWRWLDLVEAAPHVQGFPLPPARLRFRVGESCNIKGFLEVGRRAALNLEATLAGLGIPLENHRSVLDFGCGCGRTLMWLTRLNPGSSYFGTDTDRESVEWCRRHLAGTFTLNSPLPPLPYADNRFDLVYAISVFTHLSKDFQAQWATELHRVLRPGGLLLLTIHGDSSRKDLSRQELATLEADGVLFRTSRKMKGILPSWYQTALHSPTFLQGLLLEHFGSVYCVPHGMGDQDAFVARKRTH